MNNGGYYGHQAKFFKQPFKDNSLQQLTTRRIVALEAFWRKNPTTKAKANMATGILLNNQLVLTAGHNVYNNDFRQIASDLKISFLDEGNYEISSKNISMLIKPRLNENIYLQLKSNNQEEGYLIDLALIKLKRIQEIPNNINILGFKISISDKSLVEKNDKYHGFQQVDEVIVCGFPDKKTLKNNNNNKKHDRNKEQEVVAQLKILTGKLSQITQRNIYYRQIKTVLGQSGAPIFTYYRNSYHLVGIHTQFNQVIDTGRGIILTDQLIIKIKRWASLLKDNLQINQNYIQNRNYRVLDGPNKSIASLSTSQSLSHSFENVLKQFQQATTFKLAHLQNSIAEVKKHLETIGLDQLSTSICLYKFNQFKSKWQQTKIKGWIAQSKDCSTDLVRIDNLIQQIVGKIDMMYAQEKLSSSSLYAQQQQQDWAFYDKHRGQFQSNFTDISQLILNNTKEKRHQTMFDT